MFIYKNCPDRFAFIDILGIYWCFPLSQSSNLNEDKILTFNLSIMKNNAQWERINWGNIEDNNHNNNNVISRNFHIFMFFCFVGVAANFFTILFLKWYARKYIVDAGENNPSTIWILNTGDTMLLNLSTLVFTSEIRIDLYLT